MTPRWALGLLVGAASIGCGGTNTASPGAHGDAGNGNALQTSGTSTIFYLDPGHSTVNAVDADGSNARTLVTGQGGIPDGIVVDLQHRHIFWTVMGIPAANDGSIQRADLDGSNPQSVVPSGGTFTPKQLKLDAQGGFLYWADREGMRILRARLDGTNVETLVVTGDPTANVGDDTRWCVGIALDLARHQLYWTQKGPYTSAGGSIRRAGLDLPAGESPEARTDIEVLFTGLVSPVDLDLDLDARRIYWTSNGDMTVSRAPMDPPSGYDAATRTDREILVRNADQAVGIALDPSRSRLYFATSAGISSAGMAGEDPTAVLPMQSAFLTGLTVAAVPK
jgi:sugar lactone lactonase YvrE